MQFAATADTTRVVDAVSAAITTDAYDGMSLAISRDRTDPAEAVLTAV